jgi:predicted nucleic acid-binding protein
LALRVYLDTSAIVASLLPDPFSKRSLDYLERQNLSVLVSDLAAAEFASVVALRVRRRDIEAGFARETFLAFDSWVARELRRIEAHPSDIATAEKALRRPDLTLRAPDAIHIAITQRERATLMTFDEKIADCARALGVPVADA